MSLLRVDITAELHRRTYYYCASLTSNIPFNQVECSNYHSLERPSSPSDSCI